MDDVAAVEIFARDKSYRFERDATGAWLLHRHAAGDDPNTPHRADPAQSERITQALAMFARTPIEQSIARARRRIRPRRSGGDHHSVRARRGAANTLSFTVGNLASEGPGRYLLMPDGRKSSRSRMLRLPS